MHYRQLVTNAEIKSKMYSCFTLYTVIICNAFLIDTLINAKIVAQKGIGLQVDPKQAPMYVVHAANGCFPVCFHTYVVPMSDLKCYI